MCNDNVEFCGLCHFFDYDERVCKRSGLTVNDSDGACGDFEYWADAYGLKAPGMVPMPGTTDPDWGKKHWGKEYEHE